jgi:Transposase DDE domain
MPAAKPSLVSVPLHGRKYWQALRPLLDRLHEVGTASDRAGNREFFCDEYLGLLLLYFFNPTLTSLRALQQASELPQVNRRFGIPRVSLGSLSAAARDFDAAAVRAVVVELAGRALPLTAGREAEALRGLTAVDGSVLPALPKMAWALWQDDAHRAAKLHLHFDVLKGVPADAEITAAASSEPASLRALLQPGRLYVLDRGYAGFALFADILAAGSSFVGRVKDNTAFRVAEDRHISAEAQSAGVVRDVVVARLGTDRHRDYLKRPVRLVIVRRQKSDGGDEDLWLATDRLDLDAELVALAYRYRWTIELFFRWLKCVLGCRHLLATNANGVALQVYVALIVSLLITLWTGRKPTKRTLEMLQLHLQGWASLEDVLRHLERLAQADGRKKPT